MKTLSVDYYISVAELRELGLPLRTARAAIHKVKDDLKKAGCLPSPRGKAPRKFVLEALGIA